jgi:hypothetical protein
VRRIVKKAPKSAPNCQKIPQIIPDPLGLERMKCAYTILLSAKKIKFFYSLFHNHLQILHPKKIPDSRAECAGLCFIGEAKGREHKRSRPAMNLVYPEHSRRELQKLNFHFCTADRFTLNDPSCLKADPSRLKAENKPNLPKDGNASSSLLLTTNDQRLATREAQNKPNTNPNKPNTSLIGWRLKMNATKVLTKDYEENRPCSPRKTNPIQTQRSFLPKCSFFLQNHIFLYIITITATISANLLARGQNRNCF